MTTLEDLYIYYCRRCDCRPNTALVNELRTAYEAAGEQRLLQRLDLSNNYVGPKGIAPVLELARNIHNLTELDVRNNLLEHEQLEMIIKALARHPSIKSVDLSNNRLDDGSLQNLLFLLKTNPNIVVLRLGGNEFLPSSLEMVDQQLLNNHTLLSNEAEQAANVQAIGEEARSHRPQYLPHKSEVHGELTTANSGGHFHFASWRRNPQYQLYLSTNAVVSITMRMEDPIPTKQFGFAVLKGRGLVKRIELNTEDILAESSFDHATCTVKVRLPAANRNRCDGPYLVIPFSFQPQRATKFRLQCEIVEEPGTSGALEEGAFITIEPLDSRYDWEVNEVEGVWSTDNAGGAVGYPSWRDNVMYHITYRGNAAARHTASLQIVLTKSNDNDVNDDRSIGMYLLKRNSIGPGAPVLITAENTVAHVDHQRSTSVTMKVDASCGAMDWYLVPCTSTPGQFGPYTLTVFSTCQLSVAPVHHPHGWAYQSFDGLWDVQRNGGCRKDNAASWIHNSSYLVQNDSDTPIALTISLEVLKSGSVASLGQITEAPSSSSSAPADAVVQRTDGLEAQLLLLQYDIPDFGPMKVSEFSRGESLISLQYLPKGTYVLVATTRVAGHHGSFRVRVFSEATLHISKEMVLAQRIREDQLAAYAAENETRRLASDPARVQERLMSTQQYQDEFVSAMKDKEAVIREYLATGTLFTDRDFPRGESSLWLGIDAPPQWAPNVVAWRRPTELVVDQSIQFAPQWSIGQVRVGKIDNDWFFSALSLVAMRCEWLARVAAAGAYDSAYGIAQFSFFKNGQWHAVTIDDMLPVDALDDLCFASSCNSKADFFLPLVEKAYAKFHRCYQSLDRRVSSKISLATHFREALMDLTGGLCWVYGMQSFNGCIAEECGVLAGDELWSTLVSCREGDRTIGFCLASESPNSLEKQHVGICRDRLYGVLDARCVEGKRMVQLQQFWNEKDSVRPFCGKWAAGSSQWTSMMQYALDYKPSVYSIWMSFEEIEYYFSTMYLVKKYRHGTFIEGGFHPQHVGGPIQNDTWVENAQYALDVLLPDGAAGPVTVTVGIHQQDGRAMLTRDANAELSYRTQIGVTVFFTYDNTRRLAMLSPNEYVVHSTPVQGRDCFLTVTIDPSVHPDSNRLILMPFQTTPKQALQCFLSVWTDQAPASVSLIQTSTRTICEGEWRGSTSGGPPLCGTWRNNPQYHLYPSEGMEVTIVLRQRNDLSSTEEYIGFTVHRATGLRSILHYDESNVVLSVTHENGHAVAGTIRLCGMQERRGMPYVIVPTCAKANADTGFTLEVIANKKVHLCRVPQETDWRSLVFPVSMKYSDRNTGGSFRFTSWRNNPQYLITFPLEKQGDILVNITNHNVSDDTELGVVLMKADEWDHGRRRKLSFTKEEILADSGEAAHSSEFKTMVGVRGNEPLILMPYTSTPFSEVSCTVSIYCAADVEVDVVQEWFCEVVEGSWEFGQTAGGERTQNRSWINNPFFSLSLTRQTRVTAVLLQYPRGPEKPVVKRVGKHRTFLPPPITNPQNKISIGMDIVQSDEDNTPVTSSKHSYDNEVSILTVLPPCATTPYFVVPHSFEPEQEADFKIMLFADQPFQFQEFKKARRCF